MAHAKEFTPWRWRWMVIFFVMSLTCATLRMPSSPVLTSLVRPSTGSTASRVTQSSCRRSSVLPVCFTAAPPGREKQEGKGREGKRGSGQPKQSRFFLLPCRGGLQAALNFLNKRKVLLQPPRLSHGPRCPLALVFKRVRAAKAETRKQSERFHFDWAGPCTRSREQKTTGKEGGGGGE